MPNQLIDISIIIPGFNCAQTLGRCFDSILAQQFSGLYEVIYSDDASTDESFFIAQSYIRHFNNQQLKILRSSTQTGSPSQGRNNGIAIAKGEFLFFLDSDDTISPIALDSLLTSAKKNKCDYICAFHAQIRSSHVGRSIRVVNKCGISDSFGTSNFVIDTTFLLEYFRSYFKYTRTFCLFEHCWGRLFRTSIIIDNNLLFRVDMDQLEDVLFNSQFLSLCNKIMLAPVPLYNHHLSTNPSRLSLRSGENKSLLPDLLRVSLSLSSLYLSIQDKTVNFGSPSIVINQFLSSKVSNYLIRILIQLSRMPNHSRFQLNSSFNYFHNFYINNSLNSFAYPALDESRIMRFLLRFKFPIRFYIYAWKITQFIK